MSQALETLDEGFESRLNVPVLFVPEPAESRPMRLTVPLLLAAGWGALLSFSVMFLMEDGRSPVAASDRVAAAGQSDGKWNAEPRAYPRQQAPIQIVTAAEAAPSPASVIQVASTTAQPPPPALPASPAHPPSPPVERVNYVGTWGPNAQACSSHARRHGYLPAMITEDGAKAGRTLCRFRNGKRDGIAWTVAADCSERGRNWTSQVRLLVDGNRLIWSSAKGQSSYIRCGRRDG